MKKTSTSANRTAARRPAPMKSRGRGCIAACLR
jgi:hypothetical protein